MGNALKLSASDPSASTKWVLERPRRSSPRGREYLRNMILCHREGDRTVATKAETKRGHMKTKWIVGMVLIGVSVTAMTEWRYSADMQEHIATVNSHLASAQLAAQYNTGLVGSLQTMTDEADVAGEIIDTHYHVHTLKDEMLAMRIKKAVEDGGTVGGAMGSVIALWSSERF